MRSIQDNKRGQVTNLPPAIISLGIAAIILVISLVILQELRDVDIVRLQNAQTINNETLVCNGLESGNCTFGDNATVANAGDFTGFSVLEIYAANATDNSDWVRIPASNFSTNASGTIFAQQGIDPDTFGSFNSTWNATYEFNSGGEAFKAANETLVGLGTFADFWVIIVIAVVAGLVIGIILVGFSRGIRRRER